MSLIAGNTFSTIRGHELVWSLLADEEAVQQQADPEAILTFMDFKESSYSTDPIISALEKEVHVAEGGRERGG